MKEWTFNLVRQLGELGRIDNHGGYVYDNTDSKPTSNNPKSFKLIDYKNDFPSDIDQSQYYLLKPTRKLAARQIKNSAPDVLLGAIAAAAGKTVANLTDDEILGTSGNATVDAVTASAHSLPYLVSYDGIPTYDGAKLLTKRNVAFDAVNNPLVEAESRYKLKYTTSPTNDVTETSKTIGGTLYYFSRVGGPSTADYPIGSFIEDYEFVEGNDNELDIHNGRFSVTPEFPNGRYIYAATQKSYDSATNAIVADQSIDFGGFPYFVGDTFASEYDDYMNNRCRTNDKIPKLFNRAFEKDVLKVISNPVKEKIPSVMITS